ncbi:hypothetical protein BGZ70_003418 [Mortierella alpina]|uniref:Uncharacterized protein n=1 Tax=Mortierella alpina TaxID=64518 RepID=A0A9P6JDZ7_MORAP|nr:hypothetical protein BGZ70_003418 [Mortierella alpina]
MSPQYYSWERYWPPVERLHFIDCSGRQHQSMFATHVRRLAVDGLTQVEYLCPTYSRLEHVQLIHSPTWSEDSDHEEGDHDDDDYPTAEIPADKQDIDSRVFYSTELHKDRSRILQFLRRHHQTLQRIEIKWDADLLSKVLTLLEDKTLFPKWKTLIAPDVPWIGLEATHAFWRACARLESLHLTGYRTHAPEVGSWPEFSLLQTLTLFGVHGLSVLKLVELLAQCPRLKRLCWLIDEYFDVDDYTNSQLVIEDISVSEMSRRVIRGLAHLVGNGRLQELESLELDLHYDYSPRMRMDEDASIEKDLATVLDRVQPLKTLHVHGLDMDKAWSFPPLRRHFETLTSLELGMPLGVESSRMVQTILSSCAMLTWYQGNSIRALDMMKDGRPWVCLALKSLELRIELELDPETKTPDCTRQEQQSFVLAQLSRLRWLERLNFRGSISASDAWTRHGEVDTADPDLKLALAKKCDRQRRLDLRLCEGLDRLKTLTCLSTISFQGALEWGSDEVDWALEHWPKLQSIGRIAYGLVENSGLVKRLEDGYRRQLDISNDP